jgi:hypothetical protein
MSAVQATEWQSYQITRRWAARARGGIDEWSGDSSPSGSASPTPRVLRPAGPVSSFARVPRSTAKSGRADSCTARSARATILVVNPGGPHILAEPRVEQRRRSAAHRCDILQYIADPSEAFEARDSGQGQNLRGIYASADARQPRPWRATFTTSSSFPIGALVW